MDVAFLKGGENLQNWVSESIQYALDYWNDRLVEIWDLVNTSPQNFRGGSIWSVIESLNGGLLAIAYGLIVLFFALGVYKSASNFRDFKRPENGIRMLLRFGITKVVVQRSMEIMMVIFKICAGAITKAGGAMSGGITAIGAIPIEVSDAIKDLGFLESIPVWLLSILGILIIIVLAFIILMQVYGRFFKLYFYCALSPLPLATFAGEPTASIGKSFLKSFAGVCLEGLIIIIACLIFSAYAGAPPDLSGASSAFSIVMKYLVKMIFNMLVLVGAVKLSSTVIKEMMGA